MQDQHGQRRSRRPAGRGARSRSARPADGGASHADQQVADHLGAEGQDEQPARAPARSAGTSIWPRTRPTTAEAARRGRRGVEQRAGGPSQVALPMRWTRRKPAYAAPVNRPSATPATGFTPYAPPPMTPEMSTTPDRARTRARIEPPGQPLPEEQPRGDGHEHDLRVAQHRRQAGADQGDGVVPDHQVGREEQAGDERQAELRPEPEARIGVPRQRATTKDRKRVGAAEQRRGRRLDVREADEHPGRR